MDKVFVGVDVSKKELVMAMDNQITTWPNSPAGCRKLVKKVARSKSGHVICEASGGYEQLLAETCHELAMPVSVVFAARVRSFAKSCGQLAKTDPIDAKMIGRFAVATEPLADMPLTPAQRELRELVDRRLQVKEEIQRQEQQLSRLRLPALKTQCTTTIKRIKRELAVIETMIKKLAKSPEFKGSVAALCVEKGIGTITAVSVLAKMPELGKVNRNEAAKLAGLAPFNFDSGKMMGKRSIYGGRGDLRKALYMPAMSAIRYHPTLASFYAKLIASGKPKMVALTAVMRKLLVILNGIMKKHLETPKPA